MPKVYEPVERVVEPVVHAPKVIPQKGGPHRVVESGARLCRRAGRPRLKEKSLESQGHEGFENHESAKR